MEQTQYIKPTTNFVVKADMSLGEGKSEAIGFPRPVDDVPFQPVLGGDGSTMTEAQKAAIESKSGDHYEHA